MKEEKVIKAFGASQALSDLRDAGDAFDIGTELYEQVADMMCDLASRGEEWAEACQEDWSELKVSVPWLTGNLSESIAIENGFKQNNSPYFWVGVDLNRLLGPKVRVITNDVDYPKRVGDPVNVSEHDYTELTNVSNKTGPDHFIENVWWVTADRNLKEAMK